MIEGFIDDQAFPVPLPIGKLGRRYTGRQIKILLADESYVGRCGGGVVRSPIVRRRESLVLYKSFNTLCFDTHHLCRI
jgi:hypothetical protein